MTNCLLPSFELKVASLEWQLEILIREGGLAPSELLSSLDSSVSYISGGAVAVRSTPSPPFGYVRVLGMSSLGGSVTPRSAPYER